MVQTRSVLKRIKSGQVDDNDRALPQDNTVELPPDGGAPPPAKRRRRESGGARAPKKSRQAKAGYSIQMNLDVLYLVRFAFFLFLLLKRRGDDRFASLCILWTS